MRLINDEGGSVNVAADLVEAYLSAGFHPAENAMTESNGTEEKKEEKPRRTRAKK